MSRKISNLAANAFYAARAFTLNNTAVRVYYTGQVELQLHGHTIAAYNVQRRNIRFSLAGWNTLTTRERLRALGIDVTTKRGQAYYNGQPINDDDFYEAGINA